MIMISFSVQYKYLLPCEGLCLTVRPQGDWDTVTAQPLGQPLSNRWDCYGTKNVIDTFIITSAISLLSDPMDCSLPGSSIHGIFQGRVLEWGAMAFSRFEIYIHTKIFTLILIVTLFIIVKTCQQPRCPSGGESNSDIFSKWNVIKP